MERLINRRQQGDLGEASALEWLTRIGGLVVLPFGHSPDFDLIAQLGGRLLRVQVKTSTQEIRTPNGHLRFPVSLVTCGGNQSWTGVAKLFDPDKVDYLFALTSSGRRWFIPATDLDGKRAVQLGGDKYAEYEIESAGPVRELVYDDNPALDLPGPGEYPRGQRTAAVNRQALPSQVRLLPPPSDSDAPADPPAIGRTRMSANHQVTVPLAVAAAASIEPRRSLSRRVRRHRTIRDDSHRGVHAEPHRSTGIARQRVGVKRQPGPNAAPLRWGWSSAPVAGTGSFR
jgi:PD-(D/E)XK endonuclease